MHIHLKNQSGEQTDDCTEQTIFNEKIYKALQYTKKKDMYKLPGLLVGYIICHALFFLWGLSLVFEQPSEKRFTHVFLALVLAPTYVTTYYLKKA